MLREREHYDALTKKQKAFVDEWVKMGGGWGAATKAAKAADYSNPTTAGHFLIHNKRVIAAIHEISQAKMDSSTYMATRKLVHLMENGTTENVQLKAAIELLQRGGMQFIPKSEHTLNVMDNRSKDQILNRMKELVAANPELKNRIPVMLDNGEPVDVDFQEIVTNPEMKDNDPGIDLELELESMANE